MFAPTVAPTTSSTGGPPAPTSYVPPSPSYAPPSYAPPTSRPPVYAPSPSSPPPPPPPPLLGLGYSTEDLKYMKDQFKSKLYNINKLYLQSIQQAVFGGDGTSMPILDGISVTTSGSNVNIFNGSSYTSVSIANIGKQNLTNVLEISCINLIIDTNTIKYINGLYTLYAVLNSNYFEAFVENINNNEALPQLLKVPFYNGLSISQTTLDETAIRINLNNIHPELIYNLSSTPHFNSFVARRLVYLWILMYDFNIAYKLYTTNPNNTNAVLALTCLKVLQNNNDQFDYNTLLKDSVELSSSAQIANLQYQVWSIVVQTLVPPQLATFTKSNGSIEILKNSDKCTSINPNVIDLFKLFNALLPFYNLVDDSLVNSSVTEMQNKLNGITSDGKCVNSIDIDLNDIINTNKNDLVSRLATLNNNTAISGSIEEARNDETAKKNAYDSAKSDLDTYWNDNVVPAQSALDAAYISVTAAQTELKKAMDDDYISLNSAYGSLENYRSLLQTDYTALYTHDTNVLAAYDSARSSYDISQANLATSQANLATSKANLATSQANLETSQSDNIELQKQIKSLSGPPPGEPFVDYNPIPSRNRFSGSYAPKPSQSDIPSLASTLSSAGNLYTQTRNTLFESNGVLNTYKSKYEDVSTKNELKGKAIQKVSDLRQKATEFQEILNNATSILNNFDSYIPTTIQLSAIQNETKTYYEATQTYKNELTLPVPATNSLLVANDDLGPIKDETSKNIMIYRNRQQNINELGPVVEHNKKTLKSNRLQLQARQKNAETLKIYKYVALAILIFITLFAFTIIIMPVDKFTKILLTIVLIFLAVCNTYVLMYFFDNNRLFEAFENNQIIDISEFNTNINTNKNKNNNMIESFVMNTKAYNSGISTAPLGCLDAAYNYLVQTENNNILLESNSIYTNTNQSLYKELAYYNDVSEQLDNSGQKVNSIYKSSFIAQIQYKSTIQLFITFTIIIAAFTLAYVFLESLEITGSSYTVISWITGILLVISVLIYLLEINVRVHTDPRKIYWGKTTQRID